MKWLPFSTTSLNITFLMILEHCVMIRSFRNFVDRDTVQLNRYLPHSVVKIFKRFFHLIVIHWYEQKLTPNFSTLFWYVFPLKIIYSKKLNITRKCPNNFLYQALIYRSLHYKIIKVEAFFNKPNIWEGTSTKKLRIPVQ